MAVLVIWSLLGAVVGSLATHALEPKYGTTLKLGVKYDSSTACSCKETFGPESVDIEDVWTRRITP